MPTMRLWVGTKVLAPASTKALPPTSMEPASGVSSPATQRSVVVFPQPLGPSSVMNSPDEMERLTSLRIGVALKALLTPLISICMPCPRSLDQTVRRLVGTGQAGLVRDRAVHRVGRPARGRRQGARTTGAAAVAVSTARRPFPGGPGRELADREGNRRDEQESADQQQRSGGRDRRLALGIAAVDLHRQVVAARGG